MDGNKKDNRDNRTGTQGPPGPAAPPGIPGPTGTPGPTEITFLNGTNLYRVVANVTVANEDDFFLTSYVECDSGDSLVNGLSIYVPGLLVGNGTLKFTGTINPTAPLNLSALPTNYLTSVFDATKGDSVQSFVTCFNYPPLRP